jgi:predicted alpha/beta-hydrolase family hydrolase
MIVFLAHGASGTAASMRPYIDGLGRRGIEGSALSLPKRRAEDAVPIYRAAVATADRELAEAVIGGQSYGGRVASLLAAEEHVAGLVLLSYPLHRPGHPEWEPRTAHWPDIDCPVLLLSGESDPFCRIELLRKALDRLGDARLVTYPGVGHGLRGVLDPALDEIARFVAQLDARAPGAGPGTRPKPRFDRQADR